MRQAQRATSSCLFRPLKTPLNMSSVVSSSSEVSISQAALPLVSTMPLLSTCCNFRNTAVLRGHYNIRHMHKIVWDNPPPFATETCVDDKFKHVFSMTWSQYQSLFLWIQSTSISRVKLEVPGIALMCDLSICSECLPLFISANRLCVCVTSYVPCLLCAIVRPHGEVNLDVKDVLSPKTVILEPFKLVKAMSQCLHQGILYILHWQRSDLRPRTAHLFRVSSL